MSHQHCHAPPEAHTNHRMINDHNTGNTSQTPSREPAEEQRDGNQPNRTHLQPINKQTRWTLSHPVQKHQQLNPRKRKPKHTPNLTKVQCFQQKKAPTTWTHRTQETPGHSKIHKGFAQHWQPPSILQMQGMCCCKNDQISKTKDQDTSNNPRGTLPHGLWLCVWTKTPSIAPTQTQDTKT